MEASTGLHLRRTDENVAEIDALADLCAAHSGGRVGLEQLFLEAPRRVRRTWAPLPQLLGWHVDRALTWEAADRRDPHWWPQGISSSVRTGIDGNLLVTSWYAKNGHGSRLSFIDLDRRQYQHVLLVEPTVVDGQAGFKPLKVHAGGLVWHNRYLHVAGTGRGFLTCRLDDLLRVPDGAPLDALGYRFVLPVRFAYKAASDDGVERFRYSFLTLDRTTDPPALVAGEYGSRKKTRRLARIPVDDRSGLLHAGDDGLSRPLLTDDDGVMRMQGVAIAEGTYYVTASQGTRTRGTVYVGRPAEFTAHRFATPAGPEDLVWWPSTGLLWSVTEHPRRRWIFAMKRSRFGGAGGAEVLAETRPAT